MEQDCGCKKNASKPKKCRDDDDNFWQNVVEKYRRRKCKLEKRESDLRSRLQAMENQMPMLLMMNLMKQVQDTLPGGLCGNKGKKVEDRRGCRKFTEPSKRCTDEEVHCPTNKGESINSRRARSASSPLNMDCSCSGGQISVKTLDSTDNMCVQALHLLTSNEKALKEKIAELEEHEASLAKVIEEATRGLGIPDAPSSTNINDLRRRNDELARENQLLKERQCLMYKERDGGLAETSKRLNSAIRECEASFNRD